VLGHPEDVLSAFPGVLHAFGLEMGFQHYWGIPAEALLPSKSWSTALAFIHGLSWTLMNENLTLCFAGVSMARRRIVAPSWSWAGWEDAVSWPGRLLALTMPRDTFISTEASFQVKLLDGRVIDWDEFLDNGLNTRQSLLSRFVDITALTTPLEIREVEKTVRYEEKVIEYEHRIEAYRRHSKTTYPLYEAVLATDAGNFILVFAGNVVNAPPLKCHGNHLYYAHEPEGHRRSYWILVVGEVNGHLDG
jgi:hypothetical protein